jgi:hypothetical protein
VTWAIASGFVALHPATISAVVSINTTETLTSLTLRAAGPTGSPSQRSLNLPSGAPGPYALDLTVEGGDPNATPNDAALSYRPSLFVYFNNPNATQSYLQVSKPAVSVDNNATTPSAAAAVNFSIPATRRVNATLIANGGTISFFRVHAFATDPATRTSYNSTSQYRPSAPFPATMYAWLVMPAHGTVSVSAMASVISPDGATSTRFLAPQVVNLSDGPGGVSIEQRGVWHLFSRPDGDSLHVRAHAR